jgi:hypothetical protein
MQQRIKDARGLALMSVLIMVFVLGVIAALVIYLSGKEVALTAVRRLGAQSLYIAEGGAMSSRSALMAYMNADPIGAATFDATLTATVLAGWWNAGAAGGQNSFRLFDYIIVNGQRFTMNATSATDSLTFHVNWARPQTQLKLQPAAGSPPANALGTGSYQGTIVVARRLVPHVSCAPSPCYIHRLGVDTYEFFYTYTITSDGQAPPRARRRITLSGDFSIRIRRQNIAEFVFFSHVNTSPSGGALWFPSMESYDGPVHTNGEFRFAYFPKFGSPDPNAECSPSGATTTPLTSVSTYAWFFNNGSPRRLQANENVVSGVRRDAPVLPDCTPTTYSDDNDNPPSSFTRGAAAVTYPSNPYSQKGAAVGRDPLNVSPVTNLQIRQAIPELVDDDSPVPAGIYVPVTDADGNTLSDGGEPMAGGVYVQGNLNSLTLSIDGSGNAAYTLVQGTQTVTVTVNRNSGQTTVSNTAWASPQTRVFAGVPKGWQSLPNENAAIIYVEGAILSLGGTLEEKEQTTIVASGRIDITNHIRYEDPPIVADPNDNPLNVLGLYSPNNDIRIATSAPNNLDLHAVVLVGNTGDGYNSSFSVVNYNTGSPRGDIRLIGGLIQEYVGATGVMNMAGQILSGYGSIFAYDRRMSRGTSPPYYPTTNLFEIAGGTEGLAGVRPVWREASP